MDKINFEVVNDKELQKLFSELLPAVQNKVVIQGLKDAAKIINVQARSNYQSSSKGKGKTNKMNSAFKIEPYKNKDILGVKVGVKYYKARWIEWGTAQREYRTKKGNTHRTGALQPTNFFYKAVDAKKAEAQNTVSQAIIDSLNKTVQKYENT